jgi:glycerophosphoryl diester phosphodiesterase
MIMQIYGHRGAGGEAPENTIAGCLHAIERGAKYVEIDLRLSADDQLIVIHDRSLRRTTGKRAKASNYTARELAKTDARSDGPPWPRKKDCGVPTLKALLKATGELKGYQVEVKPDSKPIMKRIALHLADRFDTEDAARKIVVTSSNNYLHECLGDMAPHIRRGMVVMRPDAMLNLEELGCQYCALHWSACNFFSVRQLKKSGIHVSAWTVNDAQTIRNLYKLKVDSVITDYPSMAVPLLSALER